MISVDFEAVRDWYCDYRVACIFFAGVIILILFSGLILRKVLLDNLMIKKEEASLKIKHQQLIGNSSKKTIVKRDQELKVKSFKKSHENVSFSVPTVVWVGQYLRECQVVRYRFHDGQNSTKKEQVVQRIYLDMSLSYIQALCVLTHFSKGSWGWDLSSILIKRDEPHSSLSMQFELISS